jgi:hypothetical protein
VLGYYFNKVSTEARAENAEATAQAAVANAQEAKVETEKLKANLDETQQEAQEVKAVLKDVSQAAEKVLAPSSPAEASTLSPRGVADVTSNQAYYELQAALERARRLY